MIFRVLIKIGAVITCLLACTLFAMESEKSQIIILSKNFSGYTSNIAKNIELSSLNQKYTIHSESINNWKPNENTKLYIALGLDALRVLQEQQIKKPVLAGLITSSQWLQFKSNNPSTSFNTIFYDPDPLKQLILAKNLIPIASTIGVMHSEQYHFDQTKLLAAGEQLKLQINFKVNNSSDNFNRQYADISNNNDGIMLIPDRALYNRNTIPKAILTSYRQSKFIIGYSKGMVKSGALASSYTSSNDYIQDLIDSSEAILNSNTQLINRFSKYFSVATNREVAKSLGLALPSKNDLENMIKEQISKISLEN